jgi:hypothetical protein
LFLHLSAAEKPAPPHHFPLPRLVLPAPFLHGLGEALPPTRVILVVFENGLSAVSRFMR